MGRKTVIKSFEMITSGSMASDVTSSIVNVINLDQASIFVSWTGSSPLGELDVEAQNGDDQPWYVLDFNSTIPVSGNSGDLQLLFSEMPFTSIRLQYNRTSGTGSLNAVISAKTEGA